MARDTTRASMAKKLGEVAKWFIWSHDVIALYGSKRLTV
jgi:hypothetical protein